MALGGESYDLIAFVYLYLNTSYIIYYCIYFLYYSRCNISIVFTYFYTLAGTNGSALGPCGGSILALPSAVVMPSGDGVGSCPGNAPRPLAGRQGGVCPGCPDCMLKFMIHKG